MRVLVVEDEVDIAEGVARGLREEGFEVDLAYEGLDGFDRARSGAYDAIVLDLLLPGMNGFKICRGLREAGVWTPILMLTAKDGEYDEAEALDTGADDFLRKPFSYVVLVARLRALTRRVSDGAQVPILVGDLELDPVKRRCRRNGQDIDLSPREYSLLETLMRHAGEIFEAYVKLGTRITLDSTSFLQQLEDPAKMADTIAANAMLGMLGIGVTDDRDINVMYNNLMVGGATVAAVGLVGSSFPSARARSLQHDLPASISLADAQAIAAKRNEALRQELSLSPAEVWGVESQTR